MSVKGAFQQAIESEMQGMHRDFVRQRERQLLTLFGAGILPREDTLRLLEAPIKIDPAWWYCQYCTSKWEWETKRCESCGAPRR